MTEITMKNEVGHNVAESARLLRRYLTVERSSMRILSGWLPEIPEWEVKKAVAKHIADEAKHAAWLRERLRELRGGRPDVDAEPGLVQLMDVALNAPNTAGLLAGLYLVIKAKMVKAIEAQIERSNYVVEAPTVELLKRIYQQENEHLEWARSTYETENWNKGDLEVAEEWRSFLEGELEGLGDLHSLRLKSNPLPKLPAAYTPFTRSMEGKRDERFDVRPASEVYKTQAEMNAETFEESIITNFQIYATEMWAAEVVASCIFDAPQSMPWEFFVDLAQQCWDEARHASMGEQRLAELGIGLDEFPTAVSEYERSVRMPMLHRFCDLTIMAEAEHIHVRRPRLQKYLEYGDRRSAEFVDYDWSDEINHVRYGYRWVNYLLEDDARNLEDLKDEVWQMRRELAASDPRFKLPPYFEMED